MMSLLAMSIRPVCAKTRLELPDQLDPMLINEWMWLESCMYLGWLSAVLCEVCIILVPFFWILLWCVITIRLCMCHYSMRVEQWHITRREDCFLSPIVQRRKVMAHPTNGFSMSSSGTGNLSAPSRCAHPPPRDPPTLLTQNLSPENVARRDTTR